MKPTLPILMQKGTLKFAVQFHSWNKLPDQVHLTSVIMNKAVLICQISEHNAFIDTLTHTKHILFEIPSPVSQ